MAAVNRSGNGYVTRCPSSWNPRFTRDSSGTGRSRNTNSAIRAQPARPSPALTSSPERLAAGASLIPERYPHPSPAGTLLGMAGPWRTFVALGDSLTEGVGDPL